MSLEIIDRVLLLNMRWGSILLKFENKHRLVECQYKPNT